MIDPKKKPKFKLGDVVRLKSGSWPMTVIGIYGEDEAEPSIMCRWFVEAEGVFKSELAFPTDALVESPAERDPQRVP